MADFNCPECGKPLARRTRKNDEGYYFWSCTGYQENQCKFSADDWNDEPFLATCPECSQILRKGVSKKSGKKYTACFNSEGHASNEPIFFNEDGSLRGQDQDKPKAKGTFTCPECGQELKYFRIKNGKHAGETSFGCFNNAGHTDGKAHFWNDNSGRPLL